MRSLVSAFAVLAGFTSPLVAQSIPPVRALGPVTHVSSPGILGSVSMVRPLPNGDVIVNDLTRRQLVLLDAKLSKQKLIADTTMATGKSYGSALAGLIAFSGDSSLFVEPSSLSMLVIDGKGDVVRVMAAPRPQDVNSMVGGPFGTPAMDPRGRVVSRSIVKRATVASNESLPRESKLHGKSDDSAFVYRVDLATRVVDTIAWVRVPVTSMTLTLGQKGQRHVVSRSNPMPVVDDWALMPDGRVAVVRGADFHVDWIAMQGSVASTPKIPYPWERLSDETKQLVLDSLRAADRLRAEATLGTRSDGGAATRSVEGTSPTVSGLVISNRLAGDLSPPPPPAVYSSDYVLPGELPDYRPAFRLGATRADPDGNLWVRTTMPSKEGAIYYVINDKGQLVDRVKLPFGRVISGFGPGVVYMGVLDDKGARLEKARVK